MKRFLFFAAAVMLFAACSKDALDEQQGIQNIVDEAPATLTVGFEDDETRIQLNSAQKTVWTNGDLVSVFYRSNANQQWQYTGETGARTADLTCVDAGEATKETQRVVVVYPYNANYYFNTETYNVQASLPATQTYLKDSYGLDGNIMISQSEYNNISLKNVCGWLKLQLTGNGEQIKSITVRGNSGEQVAGELYINSADATATLASEAGDAGEDEGENATGGAGGNLVFEDTVLTEVTLNCVDGVALGAEATAFYIALPPQTFTKGLTVEITATNGLVMTKSTDNEVVIERNHIKPMKAFAADLTVPETWKIYYTATAKVEPYKTDEFGATYVSNEWDSETGEGVITFDGDVTKIGVSAFNGYKLNSIRDTLTSVTIPDSVTTIGDYAFYGCDNLAEFKGKFAEDNGRCLIIDDVFKAFACGCGVTEYNIPDGIQSIGYGAFYRASSLTKINFTNSVKYIDGYAFQRTGIVNLVIPDHILSIGEYAFGSCNNLKSVTIGDGVGVIGSCAFNGCDSLTSVTIGDSVTTIGEWAFASCGNLTSVTIPDSVTTIGSRAFQDCRSLTSVTIGDSVTTIGDDTFYNCTSLTSVTIGDSVTTIASRAFGYCESLKEFKGKFAADGGRCLIIDGVLNAFAIGCGVTQYTIPDSVTTIGDDAFLYCTSLTSVTIPNSVTTIGAGAFYVCTKLTSVTIPNSVTTIGAGAFYACTSLKTVYCKPTTPPAGGSGMFDANASGRKIYVPAGSGADYKEKQYWSTYKDYIYESSSL